MERLAKIKQLIRQLILGSTKTIEMRGADVDDLLQKYSSEEVTNELFEFGRVLLATNDDRVALIDSKATTLVGYSSAILAFLLIRGPSGMHFCVESIAIAVAGIFAGAACVCAGLALRGAQNWSALSEATWLPQEQIVAGPDPLKRFYIGAMHQVLQDNHRIANRKADQMILAQFCVAVAGMLLAVTLIWSVLSQSFSPPFGVYSTSAAPRAAMCSPCRGDSALSVRYLASAEDQGERGEKREQQQALESVLSADSPDSIVRSGLDRLWPYVAPDSLNRIG